jgi:hypothetical protein
MWRVYAMESTRHWSPVRLLPLRLLLVERNTELGEWVHIPCTYAGGAKGTA